MVTRILASRRWRWWRLAAGVAIMLGGAAIGDLEGFVVTLLGFVAFVESLYDVNLVAPFLGRPLRAAELRDKRRVRVVVARRRVGAAMDRRMTA